MHLSLPTNWPEFLVDLRMDEFFPTIHLYCSLGKPDGKKRFALEYTTQKPEEYERRPDFVRGGKTFVQLGLDEPTDFERMCPRAQPRYLGMSLEGKTQNVVACALKIIKK